MILIHPRSLRHLERRRPDTWNKAQTLRLVIHRGETVGKERRVRRAVFPARVLVTLVNVEDVITERFEMLRFPLGVRRSGSVIQSEVVCRPAPPTHQRRCRSSRMMNLPDERTISVELMVIVSRQSK